MTAVRVLVCDDNPTIRLTLTRGLGARSQVEVVGAAESGEEAVDLVRQTVPDVIVMDYFMPGINGVEATRRIRQLGYEMPVILFSAADRGDGADEDLGRMVRLPKVSLGELMKVILELAEGSG